MIVILASLALLSQDTVSYARADAWLCRPGRPDACSVDLRTTVIASNGTMSNEAGSAVNTDAAVDCFYIYPTVSRDTSVNSDMIAGSEERGVVRQQFARFTSLCKPYAPLYRQVTLRGLQRMMANPAGGLALNRGMAYDDVAAAWRYYLANDNHGRGVVLIGHSQGAMILEELIRRELDGKPAQGLVVSALLLGTSVAVPRGKDVGGAFRSVPLCRRADQAGCVLTYASFRSTVPPSAQSFFARVSGEGMEAGCTNPAAMAGGSAPLHSYLSAEGTTLGGSAPPRAPEWVRAGPPVTTPFVSVPGLLTGECVSDAAGSRLVITVHGDAADPRVDDITGDLGVGTPAQAQWGLHLIDMGLAMGNLIDVVRGQSAAWRSKR